MYVSSIDTRRGAITYRVQGYHCDVRTDLFCVEGQSPHKQHMDNDRDRVSGDRISS